MHPAVGPASFISQSGNMGIQLMAAAEDRKGGIGKFVGVGNEALFDTTDLFEYFRTDPQTGVILAYIEGFDDGRRFLEVARKATMEKPVIVLRSAISEFGRKAALSHTGAMAGSARVFEGMVRQSGIIATTDPDEFLDLAFSLSYMPLPRGKRVAIVTMGGGWGVLSADEVERTGLQLAQLPPDVIAEISEVLPDFWSHGNPVDLVGTLANDGAGARDGGGGPLRRRRRGDRAGRGGHGARQREVPGDRLSPAGGRRRLRHRGGDRGTRGLLGAGSGLHPVGQRPHGPLPEAHHQRVVHARRSGRLPRRRAVRLGVVAITAAVGARHRQDGGVPRVPGRGRSRVDPGLGRGGRARAT